MKAVERSPTGFRLGNARQLSRSYNEKRLEARYQHRQESLFATFLSGKAQIAGITEYLAAEQSSELAKQDIINLFSTLRICFTS